MEKVKRASSGVRYCGVPKMATLLLRRSCSVTRQTFIMAFLLSGACGVTATAVGRPNPSLVESVSTQMFEIGYRLEGGSDQVDSIHLWYTTDDGVTWRKYGVDRNAASTMPFQAAQEGLHGFYVVAHNSAGPSSADPGPNTAPHHWAYVDYTPPIVRLRPPRFDKGGVGMRTVRIEWSVLDRNLPPRPIVLSYREVPEGEWLNIGGPIVNAGEFRWEVDEGVGNLIAIRITVRDRGGHVVEATSDPLMIEPIKATVPPSPGPVPTIEARLAAFSGRETDDQDAGQRARATNFYLQGVVHSLSGEYKLAASRLGDALALEPGLTGALVELANVLYAQGEMGEAVDAYGLALQQKPRLRSGLQGLARVHIHQRRFPEAVQTLSRMVRADGNDVEAWLNLGDVAIYQGDESLALEHYNRAATLNPARVDIVAKARLRLADLKRLAAGFNQPTP